MLVVTDEMAQNTPVSLDSVLITVKVPADAKVWINEQETASTGETRLFSASGMKAEKKYDFVVRIRAYVDGKWIDKSTKVLLESGERETVAFDKLLAEDATEKPDTAPNQPPSLAYTTGATDK